jgi:hypothetical protein
LENYSKTGICEENSIKSLGACITLRIIQEGRGFVLPPTRIAPPSHNVAYCGLSIFTAQFFRVSFLKYIAILISDEGGLVSDYSDYFCAIPFACKQSIYSELGV